MGYNSAWLCTCVSVCARACPVLFYCNIKACSVNVKIARAYTDVSIHIHGVMYCMHLRINPLGIPWTDKSRDDHSLPSRDCSHPHRHNPTDRSTGPHPFPDINPESPIQRVRRTDARTDGRGDSVALRKRRSRRLYRQQ